MGQLGRDTESFRFYEMAASKGFVQGVYNMGVLYAHGKGVIGTNLFFLIFLNFTIFVGLESRHMGAELYLKAALKGYQNAQFNLGLYLHAMAMVEMAVFWFRKAADTGHAKACFNLGMYLKTMGDYCSATTYLSRAMAKGHDKAGRKLVLMLPKAAHDVRALYMLGDTFKVSKDFFVFFF
jgi:TPR repeat protein